jgi:hypothetical protein
MIFRQLSEIYQHPERLAEWLDLLYKFLQAWGNRFGESKEVGCFSSN